MVVVMIGEENKFAFVSCPKTGTHTMYEVLPRFGGKRFAGMHHRRVPRGATGFCKFGIVRNPYSRAVSAWWSNVQRPLRSGAVPRQRGLHGHDLIHFAEYLLTQSEHPGKPQLFGNQSRWYHGTPLDVMLRTETLEQDFNRLPFVGEHVTLPMINASEGCGPWRDYMTPAIVELLDEWAEPDFAKYGYERIDSPNTGMEGSPA